MLFLRVLLDVVGVEVFSFFFLFSLAVGDALARLDGVVLVLRLGVGMIASLGCMRVSCCNDSRRWFVVVHLFDSTVVWCGEAMHPPDTCVMHGSEFVVRIRYDDDAAMMMMD